MKNKLFGWDSPQWVQIKNFTDKSIQSMYESAQVVVSESLTADELLRTAENARGKEREERIKAACIYLHFAQGDVRPATLSRATCFHRAANELRGLDILERAAQCYFSSAVAAFNEAPLRIPDTPTDRKAVTEAIDFALRSAGRAKAQYAALGVDDLADEAHRLQKEVLRRKFSLHGDWLRMVLWIWRVTTGYGTSVKSWFVSLLLTLAFFTAAYGALLHFSFAILANDAPFTLPTTPLYLSVVNLVAFGGYTQIVPQCWGAEVILILQALASFVLIGTGVTFLTRR
jgi:hypothetical protein